MERRRGQLAIGLAFLAGIQLLPLAGVAGQDEQRIFLGVILNVPDNANVLSQIVRSTDDGVRYRNPYGGPDAPAVNVNPLYALLGAAGRLTGAGPRLLFHGLRAAAAAAIVVLVGRLCRELAPAAPALAMTLVLFGDGVGTLLRALGLARIPELAPFGLTLPEASTFLAATMFAHLPVALALLVATHAATLRALCGTSASPARSALAAAGLHAILSFTHPFDVAGVLATTAAYLLVAAVRREGVRALLPRALPVLVAPAPAVAYYLWLARAHPDIANSAHFDQPSPAPHVFLAALGVSLLVAVAGVVAAGAPQPNGRRYLAVWLLAQLAATFARPLVPFERRLAMGLLVPAGLLAAQALAPMLHRGGSRRLAALLLAGLAICGSPLIVLEHAPRLAAGKGKEFLPRGAWEALEVLAARVAPGEMVLAPQNLGIHLPWLRAGHPLDGYAALMPDHARRADMVARFLAPGADARRRKWLLKTEGVDWVLAPGIQDATLAAADFLEIAIDRPRYRLYRVLPDRLRLGRAVEAGGAVPPAGGG